MATKYWVGGTGTWDGFTATNWSDTSGGPGGAIAPCALDDVVFNSASNATGYTVTISTDAVCRDLTVAGPASGNVTVAGSADLGIFGSMTLAATGITRTYTGVITFRATTTGKTITTNGVTLGSNITFNGVGGAWTLGSAITVNAIQLTNGTFNTANYAVTCSNISNTTQAGTSALTLGSSAVSMSGTFTVSSNTTVNAGTSTITASNPVFVIGTTVSGHTFYNVTLTSAAQTSTILNGNNTFNNLTFTTSTNTALNTVTLNGNQTINGTLTISGSGAISRYMFLSNTIGTARTLTVNAVSSLTDVDFRDVTVAGASSPWSGTRLGDCGGNTNITFGAGTTKYWNLAAGGAWTAAAWATTSGGAASVLNFPLAQDTAVIENTGLNTGAAITGFSGYNLNTLSCGTRSNAATLSGTNCRIYTNVTLSTSMTVSALSVLFEGRAAQVITSAGRTFGQISVSNVGSTVSLADAYAGADITLLSGTFNTNNQNITLTAGSVITASGTATKTFTLGSSTISCASFESATATALTINGGTSSITLSGSTCGFTNNTGSFYNVTFTSVSANFTIRSTNTFNNLTIAAPTSFIRTVSIGGNQTVAGTLALGGGTSVTQRQFIASDTIGTQRTLTAATVTGLTDIDFRDIQGAGAGNWTTGTRLGDCGGNSGITFPATKTVYWNLAGSANWSSTGWATSSGGVPAVNNFPLAQDTAVFDNTGSAGTIILDSIWNIGTIDASARTSAWTITGAAGITIYGNVIYGSGVTVNNTATVFFAKNGTQTFTTAGKTITHNITINNPNCTFLHSDAYSGTNITVNSGNYNTQGYSINATSLVATNNTIAKTITAGASTINLSGTQPINFSGTNLTFNANTSTVNLTSGSSITFAGGGQTFNNVSTVGAAGNTLTISGSNTFNTLSNTNYSNISFTSGTTQTFNNFNYTGVLGSVVRLRTTTPGLTATVQKPSTWFAGANSTDGGNNTGWTFTAGGSINYLYIKDIIAIATAAATGNFLMLF